MNALVDPSRCNHGHKLANVRRMVELWVLLLARPLFLFSFCILEVVGSVQVQWFAMMTGSCSSLLPAPCGVMLPWQKPGHALLHGLPATGALAGIDHGWMDGWMQPGRRRGRQLWLHPRHQFHIRQGGVGGQLWPPLVNKLLSRMTKSLREKPSKGRGRLNRLTSHKASYWSNC